MESKSKRGEHTAILLLAAAELVAFVYSLRVLREIQSMRRAVAGLVVQESEKIQQLFRA